MMKTASPDADLLVVHQENAGLRLDALLAAHYPQASRTYFQSLIAQGAVTVNGIAAKKQARLTLGDRVETFFLATPEIDLAPEAIPLDLIYEDNHFLVINKPAGMVVHPAPGHWSGTFAHGLLHHCKTLPGDGFRPGIVHRLDRETSGLLIGAKTSAAHAGLVEQFAARQIGKTYIAICTGNPGSGEINQPLGRHPVHRKKIAVLEEGGREAVTRYRTLRCDGTLSLVELQPKTGRTHQIRVHLQALRAPVLGDALYGNLQLAKQRGILRHLLHAYRLSFRHPITREQLDLRAPLPADMLSLQLCASLFKE